MSNYSKSEDLKVMRIFKYHDTPPEYVRHPNGVPIVEHKLKRVFADQGFSLEDSRDNKSVASLSALYDALLRYHDETPLGMSDALRNAIDAAFAAFAGDGSLSPLLPSELQEAVKLEKSSGLPQLTSKADAWDQDFWRFKKFYHGKMLKRMPPCIAYHRVQHGIEGPKTRLVWGFPLSVTLLEAVYARPLIDHFLRIQTPMAFGLHRSDLMARAQRIENANVRVGLDVSGFDASVKPRLIGVAFDILRTWFTFGVEDEQRWRTVKDYFIHTPILMPDGYVYKKHQGVPSGSYFTQLVDSIVNYIMVQYVNIRACGRTIPENIILVLGDDSIFGLSKGLSLSEVANFAREIGFTISAAKSEVSRFGQGFSFLGHHWQRGLPRRDVKDLVKRAVYPERIAQIPDPVERRLVRLVGLAGDAVEGSLLLKNVGLTPKHIFASTLKVDVLRTPTGWQEQLSADGNLRLPLSPFQYLATSLYR